LLLIQLVRRSDANPTLQGDVRLKDAESGEVENVSITPQVLENYRAAYARFNDALLSFARQRQAILLRLDAEAEVLDQLSELFGSGQILV
jgi:hypothetical protein